MTHLMLRLNLNVLSLSLILLDLIDVLRPQMFPRSLLPNPDNDCVRKLQILGDGAVVLNMQWIGLAVVPQNAVDHFQCQSDNTDWTIFLLLNVCLFR